MLFKDKARILRFGGILFIVFLLPILVTCQTSTKSLPPNSMPPQNTLPNSAADQQEARMLTMPDTVVKNCALETARTIAPFKNIESGMSFIDACAFIGMSDQDIGSGLYIFVYDLGDDSQVFVGFTSFDSPIAYVVHRYPTGTEEWLIQSK